MAVTEWAIFKKEKKELKVTGNRKNSSRLKHKSSDYLTPTTKILKMKILSTKIMRGPNYWSDYDHKLIVTRIDLGQAHIQTNQIKNFDKKLEDVFLPVVSEKDWEIEKDFYRSLKSGTNTANVVDWVARELQRLVGLPCEYNRVYPTSQKGVYNLIISYSIEQVTTEAIESAIYITEAVINNKHDEYDIKEDIDYLKLLKRRYTPSLSTEAILKEANKRGIPYMNGFYGREIVFGYGVNQRKINGVVADSTSFMGVDVCGDKDLTKEVLEEAKVPVPKGVIINYEEEIDEAIEKLGFPLVVKPLDGNHGRGISLDLNTTNEVFEAFEIAKEIAEDVIIEKYITGFDYRLLIVNHKFTAAIKRTAASVKGDGESTIQELIDELNRDPRREKNAGNVLTPIEVDEVTLNILKKKGLNLQSVLDDGELLYVKEIANVSAGAFPIDATEDVHPHNRFLAERISKIAGLDICGIDFISSDMSVPFYENNTVVLEVNASPGIKMHMMPAEGKTRNVVGDILDMLFPTGKPVRIPIAAVTGTNGKTTVTRLMAHMVKTAGMNVGFTTTEGVYINDVIIMKGDCSGPASSQLVLKDPTVEYAVLECARGGMLRAGLAFDQCEVGVVTNVSEDHIGLDDINTLNDLAQVKSIVPKAVAPNGYAILNADDDLVFKMKEELHCKIALFSMDSTNPRIEEHIKKGGIAATVEDGHIFILNGDLKMELEDVKEIPLTFNGQADFQVQNLLAAVLFGYVSGFETEVIKNSLRSFNPSPDQTPGRMNFFKFPDFEVLADYAHNPAGMEAVGKFVKNYKAKWKVGIIAAPGDRSESQIIGIGRKAAEVFDELIIRSDKDLRGRTEKEIHDLLIEGIHDYSRDIPIKIISRETEAIKYAIKNAKKKSLITIFTEAPNDCIRTLKHFQERERVEEYEV
jgi:cyanophycin synthetase